MHDLKKIVLVSIVSALVTLCVVGLIAIGAVRHYPEQVQGYVSHMLGGGTLLQVPSTTEGDKVVKAVRDANPAVVAITISKNVPIYEQYLEQVPNPWGSFFGNGFSYSVPRVRQNGTEKRDIGGGSGFLVSNDGYIVTNKHVVDDTEAEYTVFMNDGKNYPAKVVARDPSLDIAIIKIEGENLPALEFGDSNTLEVGESVISIGNALAEFRNTVSVGVVSGLSRSIVARDSFGGSAESLDQLIQTDAAINQGNSGGPLIDLEGHVVGVNVAVASGAENIGFALSGNSVKSVVDSVRQYGKIVRPFIGVRYVMVDEEMKNKNDLTVDHGALVLRGATPSDLAVIPGSPADKAGILENDIILEIDGVKIDTDHDLSAIIREKSVGDTVHLRVLSKGEEKDVAVLLEEQQ